MHLNMSKQRRRSSTGWLDSEKAGLTSSETRGQKKLLNLLIDDGDSSSGLVETKHSESRNALEARNSSNVLYRSHSGTVPVAWQMSSAVSFLSKARESRNRRFTTRSETLGWEENAVPKLSLTLQDSRMLCKQWVVCFVAVCGESDERPTDRISRRRSNRGAWMDSAADFGRSGSGHQSVNYAQSTHRY